MARLDATEHRLHQRPKAKALECLGHADQLLPSAGDAGVAGAVEPGAGVECCDDGAQHVEIGVLQRVAGEV